MIEDKTGQRIQPSQPIDFAPFIVAKDVQEAVLEIRATNAHEYLHLYGTKFNPQKHDKMEENAAIIDWTKAACRAEAMLKATSTADEISNTDVVCLDSPAFLTYFRLHEVGFHDDGIWIPNAFEYDQAKISFRSFSAEQQAHLRLVQFVPLTFHGLVRMFSKSPPKKLIRLTWFDEEGTVGGNRSKWSSARIDVKACLECVRFAAILIFAVTLSFRPAGNAQIREMDELVVRGAATRARPLYALKVNGGREKYGGNRRMILLIYLLIDLPSL